MASQRIIGRFESVVRWASSILLTSITLAFVVPGVQAQSAVDFYKNKRVEVLIGYDPGASYDAYGRLFARHFGDHIPGNPAVVPVNKPGAGSLVAANALFQDPRKDGTTIGVVSQSIYFMQIIGQSNIKYDAPKFSWIGRVTNVTDLVIAWHTAKAKKIEDLQTTKLKVAVGGAISGSTMYVNFMNAMLGTQFEPIKGYDGSAPMLAMERGEIDGTASVNWFGLQSSHGHWIRDNKVNILVQIGLQKAPGLEHIPLLPELAKSETDRKILVALAATDEVGRSVIAPPNLPSDRLKALRDAFNATMKSENFVADAKKMRLAVNPMAGEELARLVTDSGTGLTPEMIERIKRMAGI